MSNFGSRRRTVRKRTKMLKILFWGGLAGLFLFQATVGSIARKMNGS